MPRPTFTIKELNLMIDKTLAQIMYADNKDERKVAFLDGYLNALKDVRRKINHGN